MIVNKLIDEYEKNRKLLLNCFDCDEDYFIKDLQEYNWNISITENWHILSYWKDINTSKVKKTDIAIVKKDGKPQIFETPKYSMIIGIQCVKIAFILDNKKRR